jgi:hypothetical protein
MIVPGDQFEGGIILSEEALEARDQDPIRLVPDGYEYGNRGMSRAFTANGGKLREWVGSFDDSKDERSPVERETNGERRAGGKYEIGRHPETSPTSIRVLDAITRSQEKGSFWGRPVFHSSRWSR